MIWATNNVGRGVKTPLSTQPSPEHSFQHLQIDLFELTISEEKKYRLVIVDMFVKCIEAFPTSKQVQV